MYRVVVAAGAAATGSAFITEREIAGKLRHAVVPIAAAIFLKRHDWFLASI
jgi:hypothetical protein